MREYDDSQRYFSFFCCSFFRFASEKTNNRRKEQYHAAAGKTAFDSATAYVLILNGGCADGFAASPKDDAETLESVADAIQARKIVM